MKTLVPLANTAEIPENGKKVFESNGKSYAVCEADGEYYAVQNKCPHQGGPVAEGEFVSGKITCPWHCWSFDVKTGRSSIRSDAKVLTFKLHVDHKVISIEQKDFVRLLE